MFLPRLRFSASIHPGKGFSHATYCCPRLLRLPILLLFPLLLFSLSFPPPPFLHHQSPPDPRATQLTSHPPNSPNPPAPITTTPKATPYHCLHPACRRQFARSYDLARHSTTHFPEDARRYDCPEKWCGRVGEFGFTRSDHLKAHRRAVHMKDIPKGKKRGQGGE